MDPVSLGYETKDSPPPSFKYFDNHPHNIMRMVIEILERGGGGIFCFVPQTYRIHPIHSKLDFSSLRDLTTHIKILSDSKILPELGDRALGS